MANVHGLLNKNWDSNTIKLLLENDASSVNQLNFTGLSPLHRVLKDDRCSVDMVKYLLYYGANPNCLGSGNADMHPVFISLSLKRDKEVIRLLLDAGAQAGRIYNHAGHSPLCIALRYDPVVDLIQMLIDAGCSLNCSNHISALHCSMSYAESKLSANVCKLLLKEFSRFLLLRGRQGCPLLCYALSWDAEPEAIKLFQKAGFSLNACKDHYSALGCVADQSLMFKTEAVQLLLDAGAKVGYVKKDIYSYQNVLLHKVVETSNYEIGALKLLYDCDNDIFPHGWPTRGLLHCAVRNLHHCRPDALQFLIDRGANAGELDYDYTPLYRAIENTNCHSGVMEVLLRNGCPANRKCGMNSYTALKLALDKGRQFDVIEELLKGGARLTAADGISNILQKALEKYDFIEIEENINIVKTLLKYAYLENPKFNIKVLALGRKHCSVFSHFNSECLREINILKSTNIYQFINRYSDYKPKAKGNQLLKVPSMNKFSVYFDVICTTFGRKAMEERSQVQPMYCVKDGSNSNAGKITLNNDIVRKISGMLVDEDLFSLLVALYNPNKPTDCAKNKKRNGKQRSKEQPKPRKRSRLSR